MDFPQHSSYRVPTKRPFLLRELRSRFPSADDRVRAISDYGDPTEYDAIADSLYRVFVTTRNLAPPRTFTNCSRHPNGPVDPQPPQGWGSCLLCNGRRRVGHPQALPGSPPNANQFEVPPPPYTHEALLARMRDINEVVFELHYRSSDEEFARAADLVHGAFIIARELSRPRSSSRCSRHPGAPLDPTAAGGPRCLFCVAEDARASRAPAPPVEIRTRPRPAGRRRIRPQRPDLPHSEEK